VGPSRHQKSELLFFGFWLHYSYGVHKATSILLNDETLDHEYLPILGLTDFTSAAAKLILGSDSPAIKEDKLVSAQTISGTGANHLGALFLSKFYEWNGPAKIYLSNPTWGEWRHFILLRVIGIETILLISQSSRHLQKCGH